MIHAVDEGSRNMARRKTLDEEQLTDTNYYILLSMVEPIHGYGIMQKVKELSNQTFEIGPASLYTSLKKMVDASVIELILDGEKKVYTITSYGKKILVKDYERRRNMVEQSKKIMEGIKDEEC